MAKIAHEVPFWQEEYAMAAERARDDFVVGVALHKSGNIEGAIEMYSQSARTHEELLGNQNVRESFIERDPDFHYSYAHLQHNRFMLQKDNLTLYDDMVFHLAEAARILEQRKEYADAVGVYAELASFCREFGKKITAEKYEAQGDNIRMYAIEPTLEIPAEEVRQAAETADNEEARKRGFVKSVFGKLIDRARRL